MGKDGGVPSPPKLISPKKMFPKKFSEGATAAANRQGVLEGGRRMSWGSVPLQKNCPQIFFNKIYPEGTNATAGSQGLLEGGMEGGDGGPHLQKFFRRTNFLDKHFPEWTTAAAGRQGGREGGSHPQQIVT